MKLQFSSDKSEKVHIGKKINKDVLVDSWKNVLKENWDGRKILEDINDEKKR